LAETEWWSAAELYALQCERLQALVAHAYAHVPYYCRLFRDHGLAPSDIMTPADLAQLPLLTRQQAQANLAALQPRNLDPALLQTRTTGGTTGTPLSITYDAQADAVELAFRMRQWRWAGYRPGAPLLILRDDFAGRTNRHGTTVKWDYNSARNALVLSAFHLNAAILPDYWALLREFQPRFIEAYPSALSVLARFMQQQGVTAVHPQAIFCESETIVPWQRSLLETTFGCPLFAGYGNSERAVDAVECEAHSGYHICQEYGVLEIVDAHGEAVTEEGAIGLVVGTGFYTNAMPLIRYQTGDLARVTHHPCSCGRAHPLIGDIVGRLQEMVVTEDGELVAIGVLQIRAPAYRHVQQFQFVQEQPGRLELRLVPAKGYSEHAARQIRDELTTQFGGRMQVTLTTVPAIDRTSRGKQQFLLQRLPIGLADVTLGLGGV